MVLAPFDKLRAGYEALGGDVAKGTASVANDDAGDTKKPRLMRHPSGAALVAWLLRYPLELFTESSHQEQRPSADRDPGALLLALQKELSMQKGLQLAQVFPLPLP